MAGDTGAAAISIGVASAGAGVVEDSAIAREHRGRRRACGGAGRARGGGGRRLDRNRLAGRGESGDSRARNPAPSSGPSTRPSIRTVGGRSRSRGSKHEARGRPAEAVRRSSPARRDRVGSEGRRPGRPCGVRSTAGSRRRLGLAVGAGREGCVGPGRSASKPAPTSGAGAPGRSQPRSAGEAATAVTRSVPPISRAATRSAALTPAFGSLLAAAVKETRSPTASAQGAVVAQSHFTRDRRWPRRTREHPDLGHHARGRVAARTAPLIRAYG